MALVGAAGTASAGQFDALGNFVPDEAAVFTQSFGPDFDKATDTYVPDDVEAACLVDASEVRSSADALDGDSYFFLNPDISDGCADRFLVELSVHRFSPTICSEFHCL